MKRTTRATLAAVLLTLFFFTGINVAYAKSNALTDDQYASLGLRTEDPAEFEEDTDPLADYEPVILNELYLGVMNAHGHYNGSFMVMDNTSEASSDAFDIDAMSNKLVGDETKLDNYDEHFQTQNTCAADIDGDGSDEIAELVLYTSDDQDFAQLNVYDLVNDTWQKTALATYELTDPGESYIQGIDANTSKCYVALTAGDYDNDGEDEIACYIAAKVNGGPFICVCDPGYGDDRQILLSDIDSRFDVTTDAWDKLKKLYMPVVSLTTTSISGQDDLVVNVNNPLTDGVDQHAWFAVYRLDGPLPTQMVYDAKMTTADNHRMRFCSSVDADLLDNGTDVLVVGGYQNSGYGADTNSGGLSISDNMILLFMWDESTQNYKRIWNDAFDGEIGYGSDFDIDSAMMEPAAMAAGRLSSASKSDRVFLEGSILRFVGGQDSSGSMYDLLKDGTFAVQDRIELEGDNSAFISQAAIGHFSLADTTTEQLVVLAGDLNTFNGINDKIYYDIIWAWEEKGQFKSVVTNNDYIESDQDDNGTYASICALNADEDTVYVKYEGRDMGWSEPELYCVLQSPPYWRELLYDNGTGSASFEITSGSGSGDDTNVNLGVGAYFHVTAVAGVKFLGNGGQAGMATELGIMASYVYNHTETHTTENAYRVSVSPGQDHAVIYAVPVTTYHYSMFIPEFTMTKDDLEIYNELKSDDDPDYQVGDTIPGDWYAVPMVSVGDPCVSHLTLSKYNQLVDELGSETHLPKITEDQLPYKTIGDPSTYPEDKTDLNVHNNVKNLKLSPTGAEVSEGDGETWLTYVVEDESETGRGFDVSVDGGLYMAVEAGVEAGLAAETNAEFGIKGHFDGGHVWTESDTDGMNFSTVFADLPEGTSSAYDFTSKMAVYEMDLGDDGSPYCIGYTVDANAADALPPVLPSMFRVYGATDDEILLCWEKTVGDRAAQSWEVFVRDNNGIEHSLGVTNDQYYLATYLDPDTTYEFALVAYTGKDGAGVASSQSAWLSATTKEDSDEAPYFSEPPQSTVVYVDSEEEKVLHAHAEMGAGMADQGAELTYQWQRYTSDSLGWGQWEDIYCATEEDLPLPTLTRTDEGDLVDTDGGTYGKVTYYRVVATQVLGANVHTVISRTVEMIAVNSSVEGADVPVSGTELTLSLAENQEGVHTLKGACFYDTSECEFIVFEVTLVDDQGNGLEGKEILLKRRNEPDDALIAVGTTNKDGVVQIRMQSFFLDEPCTLIAIFEGEVTEGEVLLPAQSDEDEGLLLAEADSDELLGVFEAQGEADSDEPFAVVDEAQSEDELLTVQAETDEPEELVALAEVTESVLLPSQSDGLTMRPGGPRSASKNSTYHLTK